MTSNIDPSKPPAGHAYTADVRGNFNIAKNEISDLQTRMSALENAGFATTQYVDDAIAATRSALVLEYSFNLNTTAPPSSGQVRLDQADQTAATTLWIHDTTADSMDAALYIGLLTAGNRLVLQDKDDSTKVQFYQVVAAPVDQGNYTSVPVSWLKGGTPLPAQRIIVTLVI